MEFFGPLFFLIALLVQPSLQSKYVRRHKVNAENSVDLGGGINEDAALFTLQTLLDIILLDNSKTLVLLIAGYEEKISDLRSFFMQEIPKFNFFETTEEFRILFDNQDFDLNTKAARLQKIAIDYLIEKFNLERALAERLLPLKIFTFEAIKDFVFELRNSLKKSGEYSDLLALYALELSTTDSADYAKKLFNAALTLRRHIYCFLEKSTEMSVIVEAIRSAGGFLMDKLHRMLPDVMKNGKEMLKKHQLFAGVNFDDFQVKLQVLNRGESYYKIIHDHTTFEEQEVIVCIGRLAATAFVLDAEPDQIYVNLAFSIYLEMQRPGFIDRFGKFILTHESFHCFIGYAIHQRGKSALFNGNQETIFMNEGSAEYFTELSFWDLKLELERFRGIVVVPDFYLRGRKFVKAVSDIVGFSKAMEILMENPPNKFHLLDVYLKYKAKIVSSNDEVDEKNKSEKDVGSSVSEGEIKAKNEKDSYSVNDPTDKVIDSENFSVTK